MWAHMRFVPVILTCVLLVGCGNQPHALLMAPTSLTATSVAATGREVDELPSIGGSGVECGDPNQGVVCYYFSGELVLRTGGGTFVANHDDGIVQAKNGVIDQTSFSLGYHQGAITLSGSG